MKRNVKVKTRGLTKEENLQVHNMLRQINRRRKREGKERISYKLETESKICVTRV